MNTEMMSDTVFRSGLLAYTACVGTAAEGLPEGEGPLVIPDPYGLPDIVCGGFSPGVKSIKGAVAEATAPK